MSRKKYIMLSKQHYLDTQTNKVITKAERSNPCLTLVPLYFWDESMNSKVVTGFNLVGGQLQNSFSDYSQTNTLPLPGIHFVMRDLYSANILFYDGRKHERHEINISGFASKIHQPSKPNQERIDSVILDMTFDGQAGRFKAYTFESAVRERYKGVGYLAQKEDETCPKVGRLHLTYGLLYKQFQVVYKGIDLKGTCYVLFYGVFGILLRDNLSFDALVIFSGYNKDTVYIQQFIYTSNEYLIKSIIRYGGNKQ